MILLRIRKVKGLFPCKSRASKQRGFKNTLKEFSDSEQADLGLGFNLPAKLLCNRSQVVFH